MALSKLCILAVCRTEYFSNLIFWFSFLSKSTSPSLPFSRLKFDAFDLSGLKTMLPTTEAYFSYLFLHIPFSLYGPKKTFRTDIRQWDLCHQSDFNHRSVPDLAQTLWNAQRTAQRNEHHPPLPQSGKKGAAFQERRDLPGEHHDLKHIQVASPRPGQTSSTPFSGFPCN